ncbi:unnamed protein product [Jaminaea pallidilutea]
MRSAARLAPAAFVTALFLFARSVAAQSQCACGYRDPTSNQVWTDAIITYFNETNAATDFVMDPAQSPNVAGRKGSGSTGDGSQDWAAYSQLNAYNLGYGIDWRTGYQYNNTYQTIDQDRATQAMQLAVVPADLKHRITWGAGLLTRRRDILFGSFRTSVIPSPSSNEGTYLTMGVKYDDDNYISTAVAASWNGTLSWQWSKKDQESLPITQIIWNALGQNWAQHNYTEHRMDWNNADQLIFSNDGDHSSLGNGTASATASSGLPTIGGPFSFLHYSSGESTIGQAPPQGFQLNANLLYARLFFNSSLSTRDAEFNDACAAAGGAQICDTDDLTLRGSTPFSAAAMQPVQPPSDPWDAPVYAIIGMVITGVIILVLLACGLIVRVARSMFGSGQASYVSPAGEASKAAYEPTVPFQQHKNGQDPYLEDPRMAYPEAFYDANSAQDDVNEPSVDGYAEVDDPLRIKPAPHDATRSPNGGEITPVNSPQFGEQQIDARGTAASPSWTHSIASTGGLPSWQHQSRGSIYSPLLKDSPKMGSGSFDSRVGPTGKQDLHTPTQWGSDSRKHSNFSSRDFSSSTAASYAWESSVMEWEVLSRNADGSTRLAQPKGGPMALKPKKDKAEKRLSQIDGRNWFLRKFFVGAGAGAKTASGAARVEYLDGLRGFACFLVSFHHFMLIFYFGQTTAGASAHYPEFEKWFRYILGPVFTNGGLNVGIFFCLAARVIANRYLVRGKMQDLAEGIFRRVPRLMTPITAAIILSYFLIEAHAYDWVIRLTSVTWSPWSYFVDYQNLGVFIDDWMALWFTVPPNTPPQLSTYATGILWTVPVIVQNSWSVFLCALVAREITNPIKRYVFYSCCWLLSWYANRFEYFFLAGLIIADLDNRVKYREKAAKGIPIIPGTNIRVHGQVFAWAIFLAGAVVTWLNYIGGPGSNIFNAEHGIHPSWMTSQPNAWNDYTAPATYTDPELFAFFFVIGFFLLCDLCTSFRTFFQLRFWSVFGRNAFSLYLLHGVVFWSWGAWLSIQLVSKGIEYWAAVLIVFITSYIMLGILCECFTRTFDSWGIGLSKSLWRECTGGLGRRV